MPSTTRRRSNTGDGDGILGGILEYQAAKRESDYKMQEARARLKGEMMKIKAQSMMRRQEAQALTQTPEQQYLRRRAMQENPLMSLSQDQSGAPEGGGQVEVDASVSESRPTMNEKGLYQQDKLSGPEQEDKKAQAFLSMLDGMVKAGKQPPQWMMKAGENARARMSKRMGYGNDTSGGHTASEWLGAVKRLEGIRPARRTAEQEIQLETARKKYDEAMFGAPESRSLNGMPEEEQASEALPDNSVESPDPLEGKTATNPQTKQKLIRRNGQWVPIQE